jgi:tripartite-type tricarboxylate transporter receptor subunit TctC
MGRLSASAAVSFCAFSCLSAVAVAQEYPSKPIRLIVATTPGTLSDLAPRVLATGMTKVLGQPIVVENRPGANSLIGFEYVAKKTPADGYTVASALVAALASLPVGAKDLPFDPLKDLPPVIVFAEGLFVFGSPASAPWTTIPELVAYARANPGKLNYGSSNLNSRLLAEAVFEDRGIQAVSVPYSSGAPYLQAIASGEVQMGFFGETTVTSSGGKVRALAVTGSRRNPRLPDVPTFTELGMRNIPAITYSINVASATPKNIVARLYSAAAQVVQQPDVQAQFAKMQLDASNVPPDVAAQRLSEEAALYSDIAKKLGIKPQ